MRTGLLLLIFTSCALAALLRLDAKVGEKVELNLGYRKGSWYRDTGKGNATRGRCSKPPCQPFPNSTLYRNGSLIFESVQESDSGMYYVLKRAQNVRNGRGHVRPVARVADTAIDLYVHE